MKAIVGFPSTAIFGQQAAIAFAERDALQAFVTTFAWNSDGKLAAVLQGALGARGKALLRELERRKLDSALAPHTVTHPFWEVMRTLAVKAGASAPSVDKIWDRLSRAYTRSVGDEIGPQTDALYLYEYSALEAFRRAKDEGVACVLDFPSLNSRQYEELSRAQKALYPELVGPNDAYFDSLFEIRQARRDGEMALADLVITNSTVTRASHIAGGADPARTFAVPYGAPPAVEEIADDRPTDRPLKVVWAGSFSIRKGAHLFIDAWRQSRAAGHASAQVFGAVPLPERMYSPLPEGIDFMGSVVRQRLFAAFDEADVLMFPTLSDGFGMVVTEAFARGLPVITTDQAGASDLVRHGENGLVIPAGDTAAIADALNWCLDNREKLAAMRRPALETARGWQWSDYRAALYEAVSSGLAAQGHSQRRPE